MDEEEDEAAPWKEQENWESHQIASASMKTGAKDKKSKQKAYDYVFEDSIDFVKDQLLAGVPPRRHPRPRLRLPPTSDCQAAWPCVRHEWGRPAPATIRCCPQNGIGHCWDVPLPLATRRHWANSVLSAGAQAAFAQLRICGHIPNSSGLIDTGCQRLQWQAAL